MDCWKWLPLGADRHTPYCFIVRIVFRNALDTSTGRKKSWKGEWKSRMPGLQTVGVIVILLLDGSM